MDNTTVDACLQRADLQQAAVESRRVATEDLNIQGTPTIFVNGLRLNGLPSVRELKTAIDEAIIKAAQVG